MRISPTHVYQFVESEDPVTERWCGPTMSASEDFKRFILNQDLLRIFLPGFPKAYAKPGKLRIFTELDETGEEMGVESRSAKGVLPITTITVPNLEGLEPVFQYCYRPDPLVILDLLLGEHLVDFGKPYHRVAFENCGPAEGKPLSLTLKSSPVSCRIALSQPIPNDQFDQLLLSRIRLVDAVARIALVFRLSCPKFRDAIVTVRRILFNAAMYRYQETQKDKYPNSYK